MIGICCNKKTEIYFDTDQHMTVFHSSVFLLYHRFTLVQQGWSGGAMVLGKLPVPGRPTIWIIVGQGPAVLAVGAVGVVWTFFLVYHFSSFSLSLWKTVRYRLKYCLKSPLSPKQPTNLSSTLPRSTVDTIALLYFSNFYLVDTLETFLLNPCLIVRTRMKLLSPGPLNAHFRLGP